MLTYADVEDKAGKQTSNASESNDFELPVTLQFERHSVPWPFSECGFYLLFPRSLQKALLQVIYIYLYIHTRARARGLYIHTYIHACMHTYIHTHVHTHTYIHTYMYVCMCVCVCVWCVYGCYVMFSCSLQKAFIIGQC
jgi:hypothetical protein